ncbi:MAG: DNA methyltransferase [Candidatus Anstonellales archaeon]
MTKKEILSEKPKIEIINDDCLEYLKQLPENSIECIITDPPAGIGFMGKEWDSFGKGLLAREKFIGWLEMVAKECLRVMKPGAHALVWALPRTSHWTATAWENAGFEVRDRIIYCFGSGFPKSLNIGKAVDKLLGNERKVIGKKKAGMGSGKTFGMLQTEGYNYLAPKEVLLDIGFSEWEGWGTGLKPAVEDWWLLRKPLEKGLNVAENVLKWGTGGLNIDACRVEYINEEDKKYNTEGLERFPKTFANTSVKMMASKEHIPNIKDTIKGRFPSHLIIDDSEEVKSLFPYSKSGARKISDHKEYNASSYKFGGRYSYDAPSEEGSASRFFYCVKASRKEKDMGLDGMEVKINKIIHNRRCKICGHQEISGSPCKCKNPEWEVLKQERTAYNYHPTVKPIKLMEYLVKLICPPNGTVLDPFMGSGSTGIACANLNKNFIGIEIDKDYYEIAKKRIQFALSQKKLF